METYTFPILFWWIVCRRWFSRADDLVSHYTAKGLILHCNFLNWTDFIFRFKKNMHRNNVSVNFMCIFVFKFSFSFLNSQKKKGNTKSNPNKKLKKQNMATAVHDQNPVYRIGSEKAWKYSLIWKTSRENKQIHATAQVTLQMCNCMIKKGGELHQFKIDIVLF